MKPGLIAMRGVRAHNEEMTRLGLTLPGFVEHNKNIASLLASCRSGKLASSG